MADNVTEVFRVAVPSVGLVLKAKLKRENLELVSGTTQLKLAVELTVPDYRD